MKSIRAGKGLGDSLYLQAVVRHLIKNGDPEWMRSKRRAGDRYEVCSNWPDVFKPLGDSVVATPFRRNAEINAHYTLRKSCRDSDQFEDCCLQAGIREPVEFRLDWAEAQSLIDHLPGPIVCVLLYRLPMDRADGFAQDLLPDFGSMQRMIDALKGRATVVQIGSGKPLKEYRGIDLDLANKTTVSQMLDVAAKADGFLGYCSFLIPLAESLNKPALFNWARKGLASRTPYIRQIRPEKILHRSSSLYAFDDDPDGAVEVLLREISGGGSDPGKVGRSGRLWSGVAG